MYHKAMIVFCIGIIVLLSCIGVCFAQGGGTGAQGKLQDHLEVPRITAFEARKLFNQGKLILANAHSSGNYERKHIIGSIPVPGDNLEMYGNIPHNIIVAFYCE